MFKLFLFRSHNVRVSRELQPVIFSNELLQNMETQFWSGDKQLIHNSSLRIFHNKGRLICFSWAGLAGWVSSVATNYEECLRTGQVISDVFCLPDTYRKDVPPHSKKICCNFYSFKLLQPQPRGLSTSSSSFPSRK